MKKKESRSVYYILGPDGKMPMPVSDFNEWAKFFENGKARRVAEIEIGDARISTVFLGIDHNWSGGPPVLWETMIFGGTYGGYQERAISYAQALKNHVAAEMLVRG